MVEGILYNYPKLKVEIDNLRLDLEEVNVVRQWNITKLVSAEHTYHITEIFHLRNINFIHHMLGRSYGIGKTKNILIARDVGVSGGYR